LLLIQKGPAILKLINKKIQFQINNTINPQEFKIIKKHPSKKN
jgi:hypothetical protein